MNIPKLDLQAEQWNELFHLGKQEGFNEQDVLCFLSIILTGSELRF